MASCRSCLAPIVFARTRSRKLMPIELAFSAEENFVEEAIAVRLGRRDLCDEARSEVSIEPGITAIYLAVRLAAPVEQRCTICGSTEKPLVRGIGGFPVCNYAKHCLDRKRAQDKAAEIEKERG